MKNLVMKLMRAFGKAFTEDDEEKLFDEIKALVDEKEQRITALATELEGARQKAASLEPLAADGKAYRDDLVGQYVTHKAKLGEVAETPEAQKAVREVAAAYPIAFLKDEVKTLEKRVCEKFPDTGKLPGDTRQDKTGDDPPSGGKNWQTKNPLVPEEG